MNIEIVPFPHSFYPSLTSMILFDLLTTHWGMAALQRLTHPWPEDQVSPAAEAASAAPLKPVLAVGLGGGQSTNPIRHALEHAAVLAEATGDDQRRIPDPSADGRDALTDRIRGRWIMPEPWSRNAFERIFGRTLEQVWGEIQGGQWKTYTALAKGYKRKPSWVSRSLKYCMLREKVIDSANQFDSYFKHRN